MLWWTKIEDDEKIFLVWECTEFRATEHKPRSCTNKVEVMGCKFTFPKHGKTRLTEMEFVRIRSIG